MAIEPGLSLPGALGLLLACLLLVSASQIGWLLQGWDETARRRWTPRLIALAVGVLAGDIVLHLVPHGLSHQAISWSLALAAAGGLLFMGLLERVFGLLDRAAHTAHPERTAGRLSLGGDASHSLADGLMLGAAFAMNPLTGLSAMVAILAHELAQELGEAGILLDSGYSLPRAMRLNLLCALPVVPGAVLGLLLANTAHRALPWLHLFVAGSFAYLILVRLLPRLFRSGVASAAGLVLWIVAGLLWVGVFELQHR